LTPSTVDGHQSLSLPPVASQHFQHFASPAAVAGRPLSSTSAPAAGTLSVATAMASVAMTVGFIYRSSAVSTQPGPPPLPQRCTISADGM